MTGAITRGVGLHLGNVTRRFQTVPVLTGVDLEVPPGQFLAIVGRSGCGKSTLLRLLVGLDTPTSGRVALTAPGGGEVRSRIMFQEPRLLPWASVAENVALGLGPGPDPATRRAEAARALGAVELGDKGGDWPAALSGGQRQRVALARALISRPGFLALDEPLGALDALTRITMQTLLETVWRTEGFTALLVTHDVAEAVALADRVIVLDQGRVALDLAVNLPRPRPRGSAAFGALEARLLDAIFGTRTAA